MLSVPRDIGDPVGSCTALQGGQFLPTQKAPPDFVDAIGSAVSLVDS